MRAKIPFGPIRTGHNQHTHTGKTRQLELNSRVPRVHPPSRAQLKGCHSELTSRNATCLTPIPSSTQGIRSNSTQGTPANRPLKYLKSLVDHARRNNNPRLLQ